MPPVSMPPVSMPPVAVTPYRPIRSLAGWSTAAAIGIAACALVALVDAFVPLLGVWAAREIGTSGGSAPANAYTLVDLAVGLAQFGCHLVAGGCFVVWLYRARANLGAFYDAYPRMSLGLAVGAWFIPVANFVLPGLVVADAARESVPPGEGAPSRRRRLVALVWSWWAVYVLATIAGVVGVIAGKSQDLRLLLARLESGESVDLGSARQLFGELVVSRLPAALLWLAAAVLAIVVMHRINAAQYDRVDALRDLRPAAIPAQRAPEPVSGVPGGPGGATIGA
jgi:hypothetical protein